MTCCASRWPACCVAAWRMACAMCVEWGGNVWCGVWQGVCAVMRVGLCVSCVQQPPQRVGATRARATHGVHACDCACGCMHSGVFVPVCPCVCVLGVGVFVQAYVCACLCVGGRVYVCVDV